MKRPLIVVFILMSAFLLCVSCEQDYDRFNSMYQKKSWDSLKYNFLAIGNSVTVHPYTSYWHEYDRGMAASSDEKDYVHIVADYLEQEHGPVVFNARNLAFWERNPDKRQEQLLTLDDWLSADLDLVIIQLGDNVSVLDTLEDDFGALVDYVRTKAPQAQLVVIGDFIRMDGRQEIKQSVALSKSVPFVDLGDEIRNDPKFTVGIGSYVEDYLGRPVKVTHRGVAIHPGDLGMQAIAQKIIDTLKAL